MKAAPDASADLQDWLSYIEALHPRQIDLGLHRSRQVLQAMDLQSPARCVITVAGTNGKGSCVAAMEALLVAAGYRVGTYTSPHIHVFNERIRINGNPLASDVIRDAFVEIEQARDEVSLSYFEFATLAAFAIFARSDLDLAVLEVGLGGRLDAVNLIDPDVAVITRIDLDHMEWLGEDREAIGKEKAGIMRAQTPVVIVDPEPPASVVRQAESLSAPIYRCGREFGWRQQKQEWQAWGEGPDGPWQLGGLRQQGLLPANLSGSLQALTLTGAKLTRPSEILNTLQVPGRREWRQDRQGAHAVLLDVAHNPASTAALADYLRRLKTQHPHLGQVRAVLAVMADKDLESMLASIYSLIDIWYIGAVISERCLPANQTAVRVRQQLRKQNCGQVGVATWDRVKDAYGAAVQAARSHDLILVFGSFLTVAEVRNASVAASEAIVARRTVVQGTAPV